MNHSFGALPSVLFIALSALVFAASSAAKPIDFEDIQDPALKEQIIRQSASLATALPVGDLAVGEEKVDDKEPDAGKLRAEKRLPYPLCGTFILCERKGSFPDAKLFTSYRTRIFPKDEGRCRNTTVTCSSGSPLNSQVNHARLWPIFGEEFNELCSYTERQHACFSGKVTVQNSHGHVLYECDQYYDAHTVEFCMSKYQYYCRYRNQADIIFATTSVARS